MLVRGYVGDCTSDPSKENSSFGGAAGVSGEDEVEATLCDLDADRVSEEEELDRKVASFNKNECKLSLFVVRGANI